jgi:hypothetical protein
MTRRIPRYQHTHVETGHVRVPFDAEIPPAGCDGDAATPGRCDVHATIADTAIRWVPSWTGDTISAKGPIALQPRLRVPWAAPPVMSVVTVPRFHSCLPSPEMDAIGLVLGIGGQPHGPAGVFMILSVASG